MQKEPILRRIEERQANERASGSPWSVILSGQFGLENPGREVTMKVLKCVIIGAEIAEESGRPATQADR